ncbi:hypothetical protein ACS8YF_14335 [Salinisphaera sp. SWV1]|uniref:hypothetical protein n=1 Tax=Salinisphaera sp. SWV1 TaxID=3454139 RepID=UPI003F835EFC
MRRLRRTTRLVLWIAVAAVLLCPLPVIGIRWLTAARAPHFDTSYLSIRADPGDAHVFHGEWDISVRDLNSVFHLDANADGDVTFDELKPHFPKLAQYAYAHLRFGDGHNACAIRPEQVEEANRSGAEEYMVLLFRVVCRAAKPDILSVEYRLFVAADPSHTGLLVFHDRGHTDTALLSAANKRVRLHLQAGSGGPG